MNKRLLILSLVLLPVLVTAQTWRKAAERSYPNFSAVTLVDTVTGYAVGPAGVIYKTTDGGTTWNAQQSNVTTSLGCVAFINGTTGFAGSTNRTLLKTTDGGATWTSTVLSQITEATATIKAIRFADAATGYILSTKASDTCRILKTTDAGATWNLAGPKYKLATSSEDMLNLAVNGTNGVVVGKPHTITYYTTDGFATWTKATLPTPLTSAYTYTRSDLWAVSMPTPSVVYASGWGSSAAGLQPSVHVKSTDGGATWSYMAQSAANQTYDNIYGEYFKDANTGVAVGGSGTILKTTDGGVTWTYINAQIGATLQCLMGIGDYTIVVGDDGIILRTKDLGASGEKITTTPAASLYAFESISATSMIAGGYNGGVVQTSDGGASWFGYYIKANRIAPRINDFSFVTNQLGYVSCNNRVVAKTTDCGMNWTIVLPETLVTTFYLNGIWFTDALTGYAVGQSATNVDCIYSTTDGGTTWSLRQNTSGTNLKRLNDVSFSSSQKGVAVGDGMKIVYTTDAGGSWTLSVAAGVPTAVGTTNNLRRVAFANDSVAFAVGQKAILKSLDYGATWAFFDSSSTADFYDVKFVKSSGLGYIIGTKAVYKTTNFGSTWSPNILDTAVTHQTALYGGAIDPSGNLWVGSGYATIFTTAPVTSVEQTDPAIPQNHSLAQNYPNPFNPNTVISYQLSAVTSVDLRVYDMLGREVAVLVSGVQNPGTYKATFDATKLASGMYLYRLNAGTFSSVKKMLLMK